MNEMTIEELEIEVLRHKKLYYKGYPEISDYDFDKLENKLRQLKPNSAVLEMVGMEDY